jgi:hypothetical protein
VTSGAAAQQAHQAGHSIWIMACIAGVALGAAAGVWLFWHARAATTTGEARMTWDKIKAWFKHSVTILWARVVALAGILLAAGQSLLGDPNINAAVHAILQPKFIPYYVIAIGLVTELARHRTAGKI